MAELYVSSVISVSRNHMTCLPIVDFYDRWSKIYEKDSNVLVALDDLQLTTLLPEFLALLPDPLEKPPLKIIDVGCGTGRNTLKLLSIPNSQITGLDASEKMLNIARGRCQASLELLPLGAKTQSLVFERFNVLDDDTTFQSIDQVHGIISTLVIEHLPLSIFFAFVASHLVSGGHLLITNIHPDKGFQSLASFRDPRTSRKICTHSSLVHKVEDIVEEANAHGLFLVGGVREAAMEADMLKRLGKRAEKWMGIKCWVGMIFTKMV
ncbi:hypothetical protein MMC14_003982 [Varicellaria rhodocarpa]|nr:hypothetical protein [Varicellaria rhodocarpa]